MKISDFYNLPKHTYLNRQQTIWWVCFCLVAGNTYQSKIQSDLQQYPTIKVSVCVLDSALKFLVSKGMLSYYSQPVKGRGKARKMYRINPEYLAVVNDFANLWSNYVSTINRE